MSDNLSLSSYDESTESETEPTNSTDTDQGEETLTPEEVLPRGNE